jgi:hypothetical protein
VLYLARVAEHEIVAPSAIFIAGTPSDLDVRLVLIRKTVIGTGLIGWLLNIVLVLCSGPLADLPGPSQSAFLTIMTSRLGKPGALFLWVRYILTNQPPSPR